MKAFYIMIKNINPIYNYLFHKFHDFINYSMKIFCLIICDN